MICDACKKKFQNPLILFSGDRVCPACLKSMFPKVVTPEITEENHRIFCLSEDLYFTGYLLNSERGEHADGERRRALDGAIKLCREAARQKNPYAMLKLGYYHTENHIKDATNDSFNRAAAANLYEQLANTSEVYLRNYIVDGVTEREYPLPSDEVVALREEAKQRLEQLGAFGDEIPVGEVAHRALISTLRAMRAGNARAPMFAIFKVDRERFFSALAEEISAGNLARAEKIGTLLNGNCEGDEDERLRHEAIAEIAKLFGKVELGVRTNSNFAFKPLGDRAGNTYFKWEPFFRGTAQWVTNEYGREYGYFYLINTSCKTRLVDVKRLSLHLRKYAHLYASDEMMRRCDRCIFYPDDFYYQHRHAGMPAWSKKDVSANLIEHYMESR